MPAGYGPIVETLHFTGDIILFSSGIAYAGADSDTGYPYPAPWNATAANSVRTGAYAAQAPSGGGMAYSYGREGYVDGFGTDLYEYIGTYSRVVSGTNASTVPFPDPDPALPPGASFWSFDVDTYEIESAVLTIEYGGRLVDSGDIARATADTSTFYVKHTTDVTWDEPFFPDALDSWGGGEATLLSSEPVSRTSGAPTPTDTVDVLAYLDTTTGPYAQPGRLAVALGVDIDSPDTGGPTVADDIDGGFSLSGGPSLTVTYGIKIGYRFWYEELPTLSYVRQFPTSHAGTWGGSPRIFPPPKVQRIIGGHQ